MNNNDKFPIFIREYKNGLMERKDYEKVDFNKKYLNGKDLSWVDLRWTDLAGVDLRWANLTGANLTGANLTEANLTGANLTGANLTEANLTGANLAGANLTEANLTGAILTRVNNLFFPLACPEVGTFIGWKKVKNNLIVKLEIPEDARRSSATGRKCRCDKAKVLAIENIDGTPSDYNTAVSIYNELFTYTVGETVTVPNFYDNRWIECAEGIHFFITRQEAVNYYM